MKILIVYDSYFGNTKQVAEAMGAALDGHGAVEVCHVSTVTPMHFVGIDLLIVGSPARAFRATKAMEAFLKNIPSGSLRGVKVLAFDTRFSAAETSSELVTALALVYGCAACPMADKLVQKGGVLAAKPEGFYVTDGEGPLKSHELKRCQDWVLSAIGALGPHPVENSAVG